MDGSERSGKARGDGREAGTGEWMGWATVAPLAASDQGSSLQPSESAPLSIPNTSQILYPLHARSASPQKQDTKQKPGSIVNLAASPAQILQQRTASSTSSVSPSAQSQRFNLPNLGDELDTPLVASGASSSAKAAQRSAPPPPANVDSPRTYSPPETRDMAACFQTDFSPRNLSGISSPLPRNVAHVAHETDFSSRRGTTPHSTQFSTRSSAPPSAAESVAGTPIDATDLEILRGAWVKTWGEAYTQLLVLQNQESNGIFARDREVQALSNQLKSLEAGIKEAVSVLRRTRDANVSDAERKSWEVERNAWSRSHGELMKSLETEKANMEKVIHINQAANENFMAPGSSRSSSSDQSALISQLQQKLEEANAKIQAQDDAFAKSRRELAIALDKEVAKNTSMTERVTDLEAALKKACSALESFQANKNSPGEDKMQMLSQKMAKFEANFEAERKAFEDTRKALIKRLDQELAAKSVLQVKLDSFNKAKVSTASIAATCAAESVDPSLQKIMSHLNGEEKTKEIADFGSERKTFEETRKALVAKLDQEIAARSLLQSKLTAIEYTASSASKRLTSASTVTTDDETPSPATGNQQINKMVAVFEAERLAFADTRKTLVARLDQELAAKSMLEKKVSDLAEKLKVASVSTGGDPSVVPRAIAAKAIISAAPQVAAPESSNMQTLRKQFVLKLDKEIAEKSKLKQKIDILDTNMSASLASVRGISEKHPTTSSNMDDIAGEYATTLKTLQKQFEEERSAAETSRKALVAKLDKEMATRLHLQKKIDQLQSVFDVAAASAASAAVPKEKDQHAKNSKTGKNVNVDSERRVWEEARKVLVLENDKLARKDAEKDLEIMKLSDELAALNKNQPAVSTRSPPPQAENTAKMNQLKQTNAEITSTLADLEGKVSSLEKQHKVEIRRLKDDIAEMNQVKQINTELSSTRSDLQSKVRLLENQHTVVHETILNKDTEIKKLKDEVAALKIFKTDVKPDTDSEMKSVKQNDVELATTLADLQGKMRSLQRQHSAEMLNMQEVNENLSTAIADLKGKLRSLDQGETKNLEYRNLYSAEVEKVSFWTNASDQLSVTIADLQNQSHLMERRHKEEMEDVIRRSNGSKGDKANMKALEQEHKKELQEQVQLLEKKHKEQFKASEKQHTNEMAEMQEKIRLLEKKHKEQTKATEKIHTKENAEMQEKLRLLEKKHKDELQDLKRRSTIEMDQAKSDDARVKAFEKKHKDEMQELKKRSQADIEAMEWTHNVELEEEKKCSKKEMAALERKHKDELQELQKHSLESGTLSKGEEGRLKLKLVREQVRADSLGLRDDVRRWTLRAESAESNLLEARHELNLCNAQFRADLAILRNGVVSPEEVSSEEVQRIHIENQVLKRQLLDLQDKHDRARSEQNNAQRLLHNTRQECERLRAELSKFRSPMVSPNTDADNLEKQLREREAAIKELEFENVQMRAAEKVFEQELDLREQKVEKLQQRMREQQSALDRRDKSAGEEVNGILQENERLQLALTAMLEEINGVRQENTAVRQENTSAHKALNQTKAELDNLMRIREDAISSHHTLDQQLLLHRQQIEKMEEERAELHNLKTEFEKKEAEAGRLEDEIARLKDEGVRLTAAAARRLEKAAVTQVDTDALRQHITRKEETIASLREALNKSERVVNAKDHAINKVESLERTRKKELDLAEAECESLRKEKAILDKQHSDSKDDCQRLRDESAILSQKLKNESQYAHQARALRSAPPPPPPAQDNSNLSRCRELVRLTQERVVEEFLMVNANNSGTTLGIAFEDEKGVFKIKHVMMGGPAFLSKQIHKDDILVAINGKKTAGSTGAVVEALTGSNVPGTRVQLTLQKATTGKLQEVSLKRVPTVDLAYRKKLYAVFLDLENEAKKKKDAELVKHVNRCFEMWSMLELDDSVKEGKRERKISDMQEDCEQWLDELNSLLDLGLNLSGDDSPAKEIAQHKKLHSQLKLREKELERELKEVKEAKNSEEREVEAMKREVEAVKVSARSQAEKVILRVSEEAKARLSAAADEIERLGDELQNKQKIYRAQTDELKRYKEEAMTAVRALDGREIELKKLENQLAEAKATLKAQTDELHRYQCEAKAAVRAVDEREMQLKKLERQLVEAKGTTEKVEKDAKSRLDKADALKQTLQRNVDERDRELTKLGEQLQAVRGEVQKSKDSAEAMANQVKSNATVQITETSAELASLYDQMAGLKENDRARADELMRALDHRQEALREVEEKDRLLDRLKNELMNSTDICQKALREVEEKEKLLEKIKKDALQVMEEKEMERKKLKAQLMTLGKVHAQKKVSYDDLLSDIATVEELLEKERQDFKHDLEEGSRLRLDLENEVDRLTTLLKQKELGWESRSKGPLQDRPSFAGERANTNFNLFDTDKVTPAKSKVSPRRAASGSESMEFDDDLLFGMLDMPDRGVLIAPDSNPEQQKALTEALKTANNPRGEITLQKGLALKEGPQKPAKDSSFSLFSALAPGRGLFSSWTSSPSESKAKEDTEHSVGSEFSAPTATTSKDSDSSFMPGRKHRW